MVRQSKVPYVYLIHRHNENETYHVYDVKAYFFLCPTETKCGHRVNITKHVF